MNSHFKTREACPSCKSQNKAVLLSLSYTGSPIREYLGSWYSYKKIDDEYLEGSEYVLTECGDCGLIYQGEILNDSALVKLYEEWIDYEKVAERSRTMLTKNYYFGHAKDFVNILAYLGTPPSETHILDFGMGFGTWCHLVKGFGCQAYGTELSRTRIDHAKGITVVPWDDIPRHRFDFINAEQVFEHLAEPLETLAHLRRSLKPEGLMKISVPDAWDLKKRLAGWDWEALRSHAHSEKPEEQLEVIKAVWDWERPQGSGTENSLNAAAPLQHINCFNYDSLVHMAGRVGLAPVGVPAVVADVIPPVSMRQRIAGKVKRTVQKYCRPVAPKAGTIRRPTSLFLRNV